MKKVPNNQDKIAKQINASNWPDVKAVGDDGNVCVDILGDKVYTKVIAELLDLKFGKIKIGDGVQEGMVWINNYELGIYGVPKDVINELI